MSLGGGHFVAAGGTDTTPNEAHLSIQKSMIEIQRLNDGAIEYLADTTSTTDKLEHRIAHVTCGFCSGATDIHQSREAVGEWPNERPTLAVFGWMFEVELERWFCGKTCRERYLVRARNHGDQALKPAIRASGPSLARDLYATPKTAVEASSVAATLDETTPARPPEQSRRNRR